MVPKSLFSKQSRKRNSYLPGASWKDLAHSLKARVMTLPDETVVLPGHGPKTTIGEERESNPYLE